MFDDPKKELNRLDAELRAEAYEDQLEALQNQEIPDLDDLFAYEDSDWLTEDVPQPRRTGDNDFQRAVYSHEAMDEDSAVFVEKKPKKKGKEEAPSQKKKEGAGCLPFVILLELIGIGGMLWWWYRWMR